MIQTIDREVMEMAERKFRQAIPLGTRSVVVTIPSQFADALGIKARTNLKIELIENKLVIENMDATLDGKPKTEAKRK